MTTNSAITSGVNSTVIDCNHPYYLTSSDHPGMILVTITLSDHNYSQWSRLMKIALSSKLKLGFIDGTYSKPTCSSNLLVYWNRCNDIVISWILNTVSPEIRQSVMFMNSACDIWNDLVARFAHTNITQVYNLKREIAYLSQGTMSVSAYFTKFRSLNDELEYISEMPKCSCNKCTCEVNQKLTLYMKSSLLSQFLMGLNDTFTVTRGRILMISPPPSLSEAYGILLQEEHQRDKASSATDSAGSFVCQSPELVSAPQIGSTSAFSDNQCKQLMQMIQAGIRELNSSNNPISSGRHPSVNTVHAAEASFNLIYVRRGSESGWVETRTHCDHLPFLSSDLVHIPPLNTPCQRCQDPSDNWLCLCCKKVLCSRFVNKHMLEHSQENHCLALSYSDLSVWCNPCEAYLDAQVILPLRPVYETAYILKFGEAPPFPAADLSDSRE